MSDLLVAKAPGVTVLPGNNTGSRAGDSHPRPQLAVAQQRADLHHRRRSHELAARSASGSTAPRRAMLNDLDPHEIEDIEIVKGPSAATLYGTDAANGVIVITTKRATPARRAGPGTREGGAVSDRDDIPHGRTRSGRPHADRADARCAARYTIAAKTCFVDSTSSLNILNDGSLTPLATRSRNQYGAQVSGGNDAVRFFVSGDHRERDRPGQDAGVRRAAARLGRRVECATSGCARKRSRSRTSAPISTPREPEVRPQPPPVREDDERLPQTTTTVLQRVSISR